jgi:hypothetical protein
VHQIRRAFAVVGTTAVIMKLLGSAAVIMR